MNDGLKIAKKTFILSVLILLSLMIFAGVLTKLIPGGRYDREVIDGTARIIDGSFKFLETNTLPIYRWFTAPIEVLFGPENILIIVIIIFLLFIGGSFTLLMRSGMINRIMENLILKYKDKKYKLISILSLFFMLFGSFFGIFEELIVLVPFCLVLSRKLGFDSLLGLGISLLSTAFGFSAAIFNPFTIGVAQKLAGLSLYSGTILRIFIFLSVYFILNRFLISYAKKIEKKPELSSVYNEDRALEEKELSLIYSPNVDSGIRVFSVFLIFMLAIMILGFFIPFISEIIFPLLALLFLLSSVISTIISGYKGVFKALIDGFLGVLPAVLLILMATSIKFIIVEGGVMDTILYSASGYIKDMSAINSLISLYLLVMGLNFFIGSASAKAFLLLPVLIPLVDMVGISRQIAVQTFLFGDGFSNVIYPTNAALMIALGLSVVSFPKWFKWTIKVQFQLMILSVFWIVVALFIGYN